MFDERAFIREVESADTRRLAQLLSNPSAEQERALRIYLGEPAYGRMRELARQAHEVTRGRLARLDLDAPTAGRVVVVHGIMGAELGSYASEEATAYDLLWLHYRRIFAGWFQRLRLDGDGRGSPHDVRAVGIMKSFYGELLLKLLLKGWDAHAFWFDWRKDINRSADELDARIAEWFGRDTPVHIVAHSMGGLVARAFVARHAGRWERMWDAGGAGRSGGRLVMLGTPNYGSFTIPQVMTGVEAKVRQVALLDWRHSIEDVLEVVNTFPGSYQMLPSPAVLPRMEVLYKAETYAGLRIPQRHLDAGREFHASIESAVDDERMVYVAGYGRLTPCDLRDAARPSSPLAYDVTLLGDGRVSHELGIPRKKGRRIRHVYYIDEAHGEMPRNPKVIDAVCELLETGETGLLKSRLPQEFAGGTRAADRGRALVKRYVREQEALVEEFQERVVRKGIDESREAESATAVSELDRLVRERLVGDPPAFAAEAAAPPGPAAAGGSDKPAPVEIAVAWKLIEDVGTGEPKGVLPVDAISVGHYLGYGKPLMAERALDEAISGKLLGKKPGEGPGESDLLLTLFSYRGIIRGELGQPFFIEDPRAAGRLIVLAGMGEAGRFWAPELTVLARELCWALGRLGRKHLATVLIGAGQGNMPPEEAVAAWLRGIKYALTGAEQGDEWRLRRVTFVENDPRKLKVIENAVLKFKADEEREAGGQSILVDYTPLDFAALRSKRGKTVRQEIRARVQQENKEAMRAAEAGGGGDEPDDVPIRITLSLDGKRYRFGAITKSASVPERETIVNPDFVAEVNDYLPAAEGVTEQSNRGKHLRSLLLPEELLPAFSTSGPVVMMLDATTARIHWEMIPEPEHFRGGGGEPEKLDSFLSIGRGFTRQLRTTFAPPPEPPPPPRRVLRVLVVADTWEQYRLRGAEREGEEVARLFESFNEVHKLADNKVEVVKLIGPNNAKLRDVHYLLTLERFDILHFAGHCKFDPADPAESGWLFTDGAVLSAHELKRIDNIPKFVFSNACESGVTPERPEGRAATLAPSFAEAFFGRGVSNFVCTAWPVNDSAARLFAVTLYKNLLGLDDEGTPGEHRAAPVRKMYQAMKAARLAVARDWPRTWGAYQHYGNPYLQFFDENKLRGPAPAAGKKARPRGRRGR